MRLDVYLVNEGISESRQKGRYLIDNSLVFVDGKVCTKASTDVDGHTVTVLDGRMPYVSRGGFKLEGALRLNDVDVKNAVCVDIGSSTGGFTDCLLQHGAKKVFAVDCGTNQLHEKLRSDPRVVVMENFNARALDLSSLGTYCDIAVCDVSFISQTLIHKNAYSVLREGGYFISLIKPQFEVGKNGLSKGGIVKSEKLRRDAVRSVILSAEAIGFENISLEVSPILGGDGNEEFVATFIKNTKRKSDITKDQKIERIYDNEKQPTE